MAEFDNLDEAMKNVMLVPADQQGGAVRVRPTGVAAIPGMRELSKKEQKTDLIELRTLADTCEAMVASLPRYSFTPGAQKARKNQRRTIATRIEEFKLNFTIAWRALSQERQMLDETAPVDQNLKVLRAEAKNTEKLLDPEGVTKRISDQRKANRLARDAYQAQLLVDQQEAQWAAVGANPPRGLKRLKRNSMVDDEAEEVDPAEDYL